MQHFFKTLLILYNIFGAVNASEISYYEFNPLNYAGNESEYEVIVPKETNGNYDHPLVQVHHQNKSTVLYYVDSSGNLSTTKSDNNYPLLAQQCNNITNFSASLWYYNFETDGTPKIVAATKADGTTPFTQNDRQVYILKFADWIQLSAMNFDTDDNPIFMTDPEVLIPAFSDNTEAEGYNIGELILKNGKKKCRTNLVQWYNLEHYIINYFTNSSHTVGQGVLLAENTNFITKNNYTLIYKLACGSSIVKLFIPKNITFTMSKDISSSNAFDCVVLGNLASVNNSNSCFLISQNNFNFIIGPESIISIDSDTNNYFINGSTDFVNTVIYPSLLNEDFVLNDKHLTSDGYNITAITDVNVHTFCNGGVLYLNRFTEADSEKARKLKGVIQYAINIVFPKFLENSKTYFFDDVQIDGNHFTRNTFFPNLLWFVALSGDHNPGTLIPTSKTDPNYSAESQYFFDNHNYKYEDIYETSLYWKDYKENGVVLALDGPGTKIGTNTNPFVEYDEKFFNITLSDEPISKLISNKSFAANGSEYNITQYNSKNCYWYTSTIQECFKDGILYYNGGQVAGILNNLPAELNVGLINESNPNKDNERVSTASNVTVITLKGDNQYFDGIYTVPYNDNSNGNTVINLNNNYALVKMEQLDSNGDVQYRTANTPSSGVDLSHLNYNVMTNIYWNLNKTGENLIDNNKITLDMNLSNTVATGTGPFITFTDQTNNIMTLEFTGDNKKYTLTGNANNTDLSQRGYFIPSDSISHLIFANEDSIIKVLSGVNILYTDGKRIYRLTKFVVIGVIINKKLETSESGIKNITETGTTYIKNAEGEWNITGDTTDYTNTVTSRYFCDASTLSGVNFGTLDKRNTIPELRTTDYCYNNANDAGGFYFDTDKENDNYDRINECFYNEENARDNLPPTLNIGLINNKDITIANKPNNTTVEFNGINNGIRYSDTNKLLYYIDTDIANDINDTDQTPVGKPYTGTATVPHEITEIKFGLYSFIPNINTFQNSNNQGSTTEYTNDYIFVYNNNVQKYKVDNGLQAIDGDISNIDYPIETLELNLNQITTGTDTTTAETNFNEAKIQCTNFTIKADSVVNLNNNTHLSVKES